MAFRLRLDGAVAGATACAVLLAGCSGPSASSGYFMVRDPGTVTPYYTTNIDTDENVVKFKDEQSGSAVTLQSSEVKKISKQEFMKGATTPVPAPAAAVAAPAPAATVGAQLPAPATAAPAPAAAGASAPAPVAVPAAEAPPAKLQ
jgi:hypothetical protein